VKIQGTNKKYLAHHDPDLSKTQRTPSHSFLDGQGCRQAAISPTSKPCYKVLEGDELFKEN
jgi:hypothetical protein